MMHWICLEWSTNIHLSSIKGRHYHDIEFRYWSHFNINSLFLNAWTSHIELSCFLPNLFQKWYVQFSDHLQTVSIPESFTAAECQCISLIILYPSGECLYTKDIQNVLEQRSFITSFISLATWIFSVGKIFPL